MKWIVRFHDEFESEFLAMATEVQDELLAGARVLAKVGPSLGRPHVDTLVGSRHSNMKELRFDAEGGVWRVAFAFDLERVRQSCWWPATGAACRRSGSTDP